jgi:hypothetical protein
MADLIPQHHFFIFFARVVQSALLYPALLALVLGCTVYALRAFIIDDQAAKSLVIRELRKIIVFCALTVAGAAILLLLR